MYQGDELRCCQRELTTEGLLSGNQGRLLNIILSNGKEASCMDKEVMVVYMEEQRQKIRRRLDIMGVLSKPSYWMVKGIFSIVDLRVWRYKKP